MTNQPEAMQEIEFVAEIKIQVGKRGQFKLESTTLEGEQKEIPLAQVEKILKDCYEKLYEARIVDKAIKAFSQKLMG